MIDSDTDQRLMRAAYKEAKKAFGQTSPNPLVGAVVVNLNTRQILAKGFHQKAGCPHAEIEAMEKMDLRSHDPKSLALYVTLEPCCTAGRTPPCTDAIIRSGIKHVVVGTLDPNPAHAGRGIEILRSAGIEVEVGVLESICRKLNRPFNKWVTTGLPWVIAKAALSLDGRITRPPYESQWLSNAASQQHAHQHLRSWVDAILVGAETIRADNPSLTFRSDGKPSSRQPLRIILTRSGNLPRDAQVFTDAWKSHTHVYHNQDLKTVLLSVAKEYGVTSVLIEGGANIFSQAIEAQLIDAVNFYLTPWVTGGTDFVLNTSSFLMPLPLEETQMERIGSDIFLNGIIGQPKQN